MDFKGFLNQFNIIGQCRKYRLSLWQCPQLLFLVMGAVIIATSLITYGLGTRYVADPNTVSLIVLVLTIVLLVIAFSVARSLEGLAEANQLKSEFISIVSHQLRAPLSNLKWATEFLMSGRLGKVEEKQAEYYSILKENTGRMGELISDLLTVSRIEQGRFPLKKTEFSLENLAKEIIDEFKPLATASNVAVKFEVEESLPKALADSSRIKVVIENFLDNAIRYTRKGGEVKLRISLKGKKLLFGVEDSGVGIPKQDQKHIFQKFFRSGNVLKYQTLGSGLGLYIAKSIIEISKGKIWFKSEEDKGSTFYFTLPIKQK